MKTYGFGADIGGTTIKLGLFEMTGKLLEKWEIPTDHTDASAHVLPDVARAVRAKLDERGIESSEVEGIGIGVPGPVDRDGVVHKCPNLGWGIVDAGKQLGELTGLSVRVGNDANVAALGEAWLGGAKGEQDVVMVTLGTGVGGGILVDGRMVAGANGAGGEFGHMTVDENETERCGCGRCGCLEQYTSATGIVRMARRRLQREASAGAQGGGKCSVLCDLPEEELTAKAIFDAAKQGDPIARELTDELGRILGKALADISCVTNPSVILIGGGVSRAGQILLDVIGTHFREKAYHACRDTRLSLATLGNDAGIYGCVRMLMHPDR